MSAESKGNREGDPLERLFAEYVERIESEGEAAIADLRARHPEHADRLLRGLGVLDRAGLGESAPRDGAPAAPSGAFGDFAIRREIGRGGMGVVYEATQISLKRTVALKVLPPHLGLTEAAVGRFRREAETVARLRHPNVVEIYAVGEERGTHFFAMEFVVGAPLDKVIASLKLEPPGAATGLRMQSIVQTLEHRPSGEDAAPRRDDSTATTSIWTKTYVEAVVRIAVEVADALHHAHESGVIHRDVKPSNVLVRRNGSVALTDFGLARDSDRPSMSRHGDFAGTPHYVSPEQALGQRDRMDARSDVFSLGVTLYECLTFRLPFDGANTQEVLSRVTGQDPPRPQTLNPRLATDLSTVVMKAIEKDPARRYATAAALAEDLRAFLEYRPVQARPTHPLRRALLVFRRSRAAVAAASALLVVAAALAGSAIARRLADAGRAADARRDAREATDAGRFDDAEAAIASLAAAAPGDAAIDDARRALLAARFDARLRECDTKLAALEAGYARGTVLDAELAEAEAEAGREYVAPDRYERLLELRRSAPPVRDEIRDASVATSVALSEAGSLAGRFGSEAEDSVRDRLAKLLDMEATYAERTGQREWARDIQRRLAAFDRKRAFVSRFAAPARLAIEAEPGYVAHLFRFERRSRVVPEDTSTRLVPVPFDQTEHSTVLGPFGCGVRPEDACLTVEADWGDEESGLRAGDLVAKIDGTPSAAGLRVLDVAPSGPGAANGLRPFDRLLRVGDSPIDLWFDVRDAQYVAQSDLDAVFDTPGARPMALKNGNAKLSECLGVALERASRVLRDGLPRQEIRLAVLRDGVERSVTVRPGAAAGVEAIETAYPLVTTPASRLGVTPIPPFEVPEGCYLVLLSKRGATALRRPVSLAAGETATVEIRAPRNGRPTPTALFVPGGRVVLGERLDLDFTAPPREETVADFWIERFETTVAEWTRFLESPEVAREVAATHERERRWIRVPREPDGTPRPERTQDFRDSAPAKHVNGIDARAFVAWTNARLRAEGSPFEASLPTEAEWEWAAGGSRDRLFPWGDEFEPRLTEAATTHSRQMAEPIGSHLGDESPFGVRDMGGSAQEYGESVPGLENHSIVKGGSAAHVRGADFAIDSRTVTPDFAVVGWIGLRLVYRERPR